MVSLAFSVDATLLASTDELGHVKLWSAATEKDVRVFDAALRNYPTRQGAPGRRSP